MAILLSSNFWGGCFLVILLSGCIGDDIIFDEVDPVIRIMNPIDTIALGSSHQFEYVYFDNIGRETNAEGEVWESSNPNIINIGASGLANALEEGEAIISVMLSLDDNPVRDEHRVVVGDFTVLNQSSRSGTLRTTSSYTLKGDFILEMENDELFLSFSEDYEASSNLPGLFIYLTNNPNTIQNAFEIGAVEVFSGAHQYKIENVGIQDYSHVLYFCKPFVVKVGDGAFED